MTQNNRFNSNRRVSKKGVPKERTPKGRVPKEHIPQGCIPKGRVPKKRISKSITLPVVLTLLHSFTAEASSEVRVPEAHMPETRISDASMPETRVFETRVPAQTNADTPIQDTRVQVLKMAGNKRIEASICADSMNRIAVTNDRITQIFGDEGTFESQNDEATGQVFLKPTVENGSKSLSLTLITEQGVTQDLTLKPTAKSAKTLVLARDTLERVPLANGSDHQPPLNRGFLQPMPESQLGIGKIPLMQEQLLALIKQAMSGQLPFTDASSSEEETISRQQSPLEGYSTTPDQSWQAGSYAVHSFQVENVTESPLELQEKDFYQQGDLALSFDTRVSHTNVSDTSVSGTSAFQKRILPPEGKMTLYVVSYRKADLS